MTSKLIAVVPVFLMLAGCSAKAPASDNASVAAEAGPATVPLTITSNGKVHRFDVEVAATGEEQAQGLMFRKELPGDRGMIFPMNPPRTASFWMKNTVIPLDMLFVKTDGTIAFVAPNTKPYSREPVSAGVPVAGVLELRGGRAAELGIAEGGKVAWGACAVPGSTVQESRRSVNFCP